MGAMEHGAVPNATSDSTPRPEQGERLSLVLVTLFRGVLFQEAAPRVWQDLLELQARVRDYVGTIGLELILDEAEGYAYLQQRPAAENDTDLPRLVARRPLSYPVSLLLALLRKKLAEHDAGGGDTRLVLTRDEIVDLIRVFQPETANDARQKDRVEGHINKVVELGFLRRLRGEEQRYEVQRLLKAFIDAQWLDELDERLRAYRAHAEE